MIYGANTMAEKILHWLSRNQTLDFTYRKCTIRRLLPQPHLPLLFVFKIKKILFLLDVSIILPHYNPLNGSHRHCVNLIKSFSHSIQLSLLLYIYLLFVQDTTLFHQSFCLKYRILIAKLFVPTR